MSLENQLHQWTQAALIDSSTAERILQFEKAGGNRRLRWPVALAIGFGVLMLCGGVLLFVAAHWDRLSPTERLVIVLTMVGAFHVAGAFAGTKMPALGEGLHFAGTVALGAGVFLAGQIFNLEAHWPSGILLWAMGAVLAWLILRQWPQAALAALLVPAWLSGEWELAPERFPGSWNIAAQGLLLLAIFYLTTPHKQTNQYLRVALTRIGCLLAIPLIVDVIFTAVEGFFYRPSLSLPSSLSAVGYCFAYVPVLVLAFILRRRAALGMLLSAFWVAVLAMVSRQHNPENQVGFYLWIAAGAVGLCLWGVHENRKLFINYGTAIFALTLIGFYFSQVLDKLGRSVGLISLGVVFLLGGWILNRLRTGLIARAAATGGNL